MSIIYAFKVIIFELKKGKNYYYQKYLIKNNFSLKDKLSQL
jgi:hypothetical protein